MAYLVLVRHGQSEWNVLGQWTGLTDVQLTGEGREEARKAARTLEDIDIHRAYTSQLTRAKHTLDEIVGHLGKDDLHRTEHEELNERDYGELTGKNKWQVKRRARRAREVQPLAPQLGPPGTWRRNAKRRLAAGASFL